METVLGAVRFGMGGPEILIIIVALFFGVVAAAVQVYAFCMIFRKAGYHWAMGLLTLVPFGGFIVPLVLALMDWPVSKDLRSLKQQYGSEPGY